MDKVKEQLSALVDDELDENEIPFLVKRLSSDAELSATFARYQRIHQTMHGDAPAMPVDLVAKVQRAIDAPQTSLAAPRHKKRSIFEQIAGVAIAASVAVVAVVVVGGLPQEQSPVPQVAQTQGTYWKSQQPLLEARLNTYLVKHNQNVLPAFRGASNVRLVGYDSGQNQQ